MPAIDVPRPLPNQVALDVVPVIDATKPASSQVVMDVKSVSFMHLLVDV